MRADRWEHGSDFHYVTESGAPELPWRDAQLLGSGRDALRVLLGWGRAARGWRRVFCPTFYCGSVIESIAETGITLVPYLDAPAPNGPPPALEALPAGEGDAILVVNTYGLGSPIDASRAPAGAIVIEDHTHDPFSPWAHASDAHYAVASLRKCLPLPDGGALWSPRGEPMPPAVVQVTMEHAQAALDRLSGMLLKARYLAGDPIEKDAFRAVAIAGETRIAQGAPSAMTPVSRALLTTFPTRAWRERRAANFEVLASAVASLDAARILRPAAGAVPLGAALLFATNAAREACRVGLIRERIYPAVLWPLDDVKAITVPESHVALAARLLLIHTDPRYTTADMQVVSGALRRLLGEAG